MASTALVPVQFHGASLFVTTINGVPFVVLKPVVEAIGLAWEPQLLRIKRHPVLSTCMIVTIIQMPGDDQAREVVCLPLDKLNGWLFGVTVSRAKPEIQEKLIAYQRECFDVLAGHFMPTAPKVQPEPQQAHIEHVASTERFEAALQAAGVAAFQVHMAVGRAVQAGGEDWQQTRWMLSFDSSKGMVAPVVEPLAGNSQATTRRELMRLMDEVTQVSQKLQAAMGGVQ